MIMASSRSVLTLVYSYMLHVLLTLSAANTKVTSNSNNSAVSHSAKANGSGQKVYNTYNNFNAGPSKKIKTLLHEVKNELSEIREDIKSLTGNKTIGKSMSRNFVP